MRSAIALLVLVCVAAATSNNDVVETINRIAKTSFGKTIFDTIWLQLESNEPIDRMLNTLTSLEDRYVAEQKEDDSNNRDFQDSCNSDIAVFDQDLASAEQTRIQYEAKLEGLLYPQREILVTIVNQKTKELVSLNKEVDNLDSERAEENAEFEVKVTEHNEATAIITEAKRIMTEGMSGPAFIQGGKVNMAATVNAQTTALVQKHLQVAIKKANKFVHRKSYAKVFKVLMTIAANAHQEAGGSAVAKIVDLCDELLKKISDSLDLERFAESKRVQAYKKARNLLTVSINATQTALANVTVELNSVKDQIHQTETSQENNNQRIAIKTEERTDRYTQCEEAAFDYQQARASRDSDRSVVSETVGLVNLQLRTLKEQLALRMAAGDKFDY